MFSIIIEFSQQFLNKKARARAARKMLHVTLKFPNNILLVLLYCIQAVRSAKLFQRSVRRSTMQIAVQTCFRNSWRLTSTVRWEIAVQIQNRNIKTPESERVLFTLVRRTVVWKWLTVKMKVRRLSKSQQLCQDMLSYTQIHSDRPLMKLRPAVNRAPRATRVTFFTDFWGVLALL